MAGEQNQESETPAEPARTASAPGRPEIGDVPHSFGGDILNFLRGRDVMVAREVDYACKQARESGKVKNYLSEFFNAAVESGDEPDLTSPRNIATLDVLTRPEFSDVKDFFTEVNHRTAQAVNAFSKNEALLGKNAFTLDPGTMVVKIDPEAATAIICDPNIMDPLVSVRRLPQIDQGKMDSFEQAVNEREKFLSKAAPEVYQQEVSRIAENAQSLAPPPKPAGP